MERPRTKVPLRVVAHSVCNVLAVGTAALGATSAHVNGAMSRRKPIACDAPPHRPSAEAAGSIEEDTGTLLVRTGAPTA